jgi:hypothetical protein
MFQSIAVGFLTLTYFKIIWLTNILIFSATWWRLFQKRVVRTKFDIHVLITLLERYWKLV